MNNQLLTDPNHYNTNNDAYYWKIIIIIGCYYILPALQFVFFQAHDDNVDCFYNNKCKNHKNLT